MIELPTEARLELGNFLAERFSLAELKLMAFDFGLDGEAISRETQGEFALELIRACETLDQTRRLLARSIAERPDAPRDFGEWLADLDEGVPRQRVAVGLPLRVLRANKRDLALGIAGLLEEVRPEELAVMAVDLVEEQALLGLPAPAAEALPQQEGVAPGNGALQIGSVVKYEALDPPDQAAWRGRALGVGGPAEQLAQPASLLNMALGEVRKSIRQVEEDAPLRAVLALVLEAIQQAERLGPDGAAINRNELLYLSLRSRESREQQLQVLRALERSLVENIQKARVVLEGTGSIRRSS